jgi:hypothetical protein
MIRHAELLCDVIGSERHALADFRKHIGWYLKGFVIGAETRRGLATVTSLAELRERAAELDHSLPWPGEAADAPRGKSGERARVVLPHGWLDDPNEAAVLGAEAEDATSGG